MTLALFAWLMVLGATPSASMTRFECPITDVLRARDMSTLVFAGVATAVEWVEPTYQIKGTIRVMQIWKGDPGRKIEVFYRAGDSNSGPIHLGEVLLFFSRKMEEGDRHPAEKPNSTPLRDAWLPSCIGVKPFRGDDEKQLGPSKGVEWPDRRP